MSTKKKENFTIPPHLSTISLNVKYAFGFQPTKIDPVLSYSTLSDGPDGGYKDRVIQKVGRQLSIVDPETGNREFFDPNPLPQMNSAKPQPGNKPGQKKVSDPIADVLHFQISPDGRYLLACELIRPLLNTDPSQEKEKKSNELEEKEEEIDEEDSSSSTSTSGDIPAPKLITGLGIQVGLSSGIGPLYSQVSVYSLTSLNRVKSLRYYQPPSSAGQALATPPRAFVCGTFCGSDMKMIAALTDEPERILVIWHREKEKIYKIVSIPSSLSCNILRSPPASTSTGNIQNSSSIMLTTSGLNCFKAWGLSKDGHLSPYEVLDKKLESNIFLDHVWLPVMTNAQAEKDEDLLIYPLIALTDIEQLDKDRNENEYVNRDRADKSSTQKVIIQEYIERKKAIQHDSSSSVPSASTNSNTPTTPATYPPITSSPLIPYELKNKLVILPNISSSIKIEKILPLSNGFALLGWHGKVLIYSRKQVGKQVSYFELKRYDFGDINLLSGTICPSEERIIVVTKSLRLLMINLSTKVIEEKKAKNLNINTEEDEILTSASSALTAPISLAYAPIELKKDVPHDFTYGGYHLTPIISSDLAYEQPFLGTLSNDGCLRLWNYLTGECVLSHIFSSEDSPLALALNGLGYSVLLAFKDRVRLYNIVHNKLRLYRETPLKQVKLLSYSHGGHLWAAASGLSLLVYESKSFQLLRQFQGHLMHITKISWAQGDQIIFTAGQDGNIFAWPIAKDGKIDVILANNRSSGILDMIPDCKSTVYHNDLDEKDKKKTDKDKDKDKEKDKDNLEELAENRTWVLVSSLDGHLRMPVWSLDLTRSHHSHGAAITGASLVMSSGTSSGPSSSASSSTVISPSFASSIAYSRRFPLQDGVPILYGDSTLTFTCLCLSNDRSKLFVGTSAGSVRVYPWPPLPTNLSNKPPTAITLTNSNNSNEKKNKNNSSSNPSLDAETNTSYSNLSPYYHRHLCAEFFCHSGPVQSVKQCVNNNTIISIGVDGSIFVHNLQEQKPPTKPVLKGNLLLFDPFNEPEEIEFNNEVLLLSLEEIEANIFQVLELKKILQETYQKNEYQKKKLNIENNSLLKILKENNNNIILNEKKIKEAKRNEYEKKIREFTHNLEAKDLEHVKTLNLIENKYEKELAEEIKRYDKLYEKMNLLENKFELLINSERERFSKNLEKQKDEANNLEKIKKTNNKKLLEEKNYNKNSFKEILRQQEEEYEEELMLLINSSKEEIQRVKKNMTTLREQIQGRNTVLDQLKKKYNEQLDLTEDLKNNLILEENKKKGLIEQINDLKKKIEEKENNLTEKEKIILELRSKTRTLENFRYVLDFRLQQLSGERGEITNHIESLERHINTMYKELREEFRLKKQNMQENEDRDNQLIFLNSEITKYRALEREKEQYITGFKRELGNIILSMTVGKELEEAVNLLYSKFVTKLPAKNSKKTKNSDSNKEHESKPNLLTTRNGHAAQPPNFSNGSDHNNSGGNGGNKDQVISSNLIQEVEEALIDSAKEAERQKKFLERQNTNLKHRIKMANRESHLLSRHKLHENSDLLKECNTLRLEQRDYIRKIELLQEELNLADKTAQEMKEEQSQIIKSMKQNELEETKFSDEISVTTPVSPSVISQTKQNTPAKNYIKGKDIFQKERLIKELDHLNKKLNEEYEEKFKLENELIKLKESLNMSHIPSVTSLSSPSFGSISSSRSKKATTINSHLESSKKLDQFSLGSL